MSSQDRRRISLSPFFALVFVTGVCAVIVACQEQRVEYRKRPDFYKRAAATPLPDELVLDDGTIVRYSTYEQQSTLGRTGSVKSKPFQIREESEDGKITLHALLPQHVLMNALTCVRDDEYQLMWDQLLADRTKQAYDEAQQDGVAACTAFFSKNRHDIAALLMRMLSGIPNEEVSITRQDEGVIRCRLRPQVAEPLNFKFKTVDIVKEGSDLKLLMIQ